MLRVRLESFIEYGDFEIGLLQPVVNISKHFEVTSIGVEWEEKQVLIIGSQTLEFSTI